MNTSRFDLGQIVITRAAHDVLLPDDVLVGLARHIAGDWGELDDSDKRENEISLEQSLRLMSAYTDRSGIKFWIITEADRSVTTVLLPDDY